MTKELAQFIHSQLEEINIRAKIYDSYSGRSMFGRQTYGVSLSDPIDISNALLNALDMAAGGHIDEDDIKGIDFNQILRYDSLGLGTIVY